MIADQINKLLSLMAPASRDLLLSRGTSITVPRRTLLYASQAAPDACYFLTSGMASIITTMQNGASAEVSVLGNEGVAGSLHLLGPSPVPTTCLMQLDGTALRVPLPEMRRIFDSVEDIRVRVLQSVQEQANLVSQIAGCNRLHESEERLARWLLMASDRVNSNELNFTQEFVAELLGARRTTVTMVAGALQRAGLIEYKRGRVKILDRERLRASACECYKAVVNLHNRMYPPTGLGSS